MKVDLLLILSWYVGSLNAIFVLDFKRLDQKLRNTTFSLVIPIIWMRRGCITKGEENIC